MEKAKVFFVSFVFAICVSLYSFFNVKAEIVAELELKMEKVPEGVKIVPQNHTVKATFLCPSLIADYVQINDRISISFPSVSTDKGKLVVNPKNVIELPSFCKIKSLSSEKVYFEFVRVSQRLLSVKPDIVGTPPPGFSFEVSVTPSTVVVEGPVSEIKGKAEIWTETIDINGRTDSFAIEVPLRTINMNVKVFPSTVKVFIKIFPQPSKIFPQSPTPTSSK